MQEGDDLRKAIDSAAEQADIVAMLADGENFQPARLGRRDRLAGIAVVDLDHRRPA